MRSAAIALVAILSAPTLAHARSQATVELVNVNAPGVGLNDPTPVAPVGGNPGTTLGAQRLFALQHAAGIWARNLKSDVPIRIQVSFDVRACTPTAAVLASAGALAVNSNFKRGERADTWYHSALANAVAKTDLEPTSDDLRAIFNINLGQPTCLAGSPFYYGLDGNEGTGVDLVATALHEFAHGMGFSQFASLSTGALFLGLPDIYNSQLFDQSIGKLWSQMTDAERVASSTNSRKVVWAGANVTAAVPSTLALGVPGLKINAPASIAGSYELGAASFGPALTSPGVTGTVVLAQDAADAAGPSTTDACSAITNDVAGRIALVDRGTCGFTIKVKNAQNAGAIGVIVADNAPGSPPAGLGGADPTITIPSGRVTITDGALIKAQLGAGVSATLGVDLTRRAGASTSGHALLNAPNPVVPGSSISHWDPIASPNLLMEPAINADLSHGLDLTKPLFEDLGWQIDKSNGNGL
ncbi:MAG TPA: PA domain-containing protein [Kofleriaceae bacterium]